MVDGFELAAERRRDPPEPISLGHEDRLRGREATRREDVFRHPIGGASSGRHLRCGEPCRRRIAAAIAVVPGGDDDAWTEEPNRRELIGCERHRSDPLRGGRPTTELWIKAISHRE